MGRCRIWPDESSYTKCLTFSAPIFPFSSFKLATLVMKVFLSTHPVYIMPSIGVHRCFWISVISDMLGQGQVGMSKLGIHTSIVRKYTGFDILSVVLSQNYLSMGLRVYWIHLMLIRSSKFWKRISFREFIIQTCIKLQILAFQGLFSQFSEHKTHPSIDRVQWNILFVNYRELFH